MRTRHWLAVMLGGCMALAGVGTSNAQPPMMPSNGNPDQVGMGLPPSPYAPAYGPTPQYSSGLEGPGYPPNATAWPNISPFAGPPVDSYAYEDGFWFNRILQGNRKYYFSAEALLARTQGGTETLIGAPGVNPISIDALQGNLTTNTNTTGNLFGGTTQFDQSVSTTGPNRSITQAAGGGGGGTTTIGAPDIFASQTTGVLASRMATGGFRGTWGWFNPDDTGFVVSGFVQGQATSNWQLYDSQLDINPASGNFNVTQHLHAWFGLPLGNSGTYSQLLNTTGNSASTLQYFAGPAGDTDYNGLYGAVQPYDMGVFIRFTSQLMGANSDWYFNSIYEQPALKVRPLVGVRYVHLSESFSFDGYDSGLGYTVNNPTTGGVGGGGGGGGGTAFSGYLTPLALQPNFSNVNVLHSHLASSDLSQMAGPEAGFRIDLGKSNSKFQLWGNTKFGALANVTSRQITGYGIGNGFNIAGQTNGQSNTVPAMPNDPSLTAFSTQKTSTSMSPMFEQSINVKFPVFDMIPYVNKLEIFEKAQLQAGYTFMYIGSVYRPQNTIIWNQYPLTPQLNGQRSDFFNHNFNLGVEWTY